MKARVVIGAGYGDCGKGLVTQYLSNNKTIVVLFNGGAQRGHTVIGPDNYRHVFHHFGSGTLVGADTFLSRYFIVNPMKYWEERNQLNQSGHCPPFIVYCDRECLITTPYDMLLNQILEKARGSQNHGSCGLGINETVTRSERIRFNMVTAEKSSRGELRDIVGNIRESYCKNRLREIRDLTGDGWDNVPDYLLEFMYDHQILRNFVEDLINMRFAVELVDGICYLPSDKELLFEAGQGLMLDEDHPNFPHVTRSKTGLHNVVTLLEDTDHDELDVVYVTRAYATRHGRGPLPWSGEWTAPVDDPTNVKHEFQGTLRSAPLDLDILFNTVQHDLEEARLYRSDLEINASFAVTHLDQVDWKSFRYYHHGQACFSAETFLYSMMKELSGFMYQSFGPKSCNIRQWENSPDDVEMFEYVLSHSQECSLNTVNFRGVSDAA